MVARANPNTQVGADVVLVLGNRGGGLRFLGRVAGGVRDAIQAGEITLRFDDNHY